MMKVGDVVRVLEDGSLLFSGVGAWRVIEIDRLGYWVKLASPRSGNVLTISRARVQGVAA